MAKTIIPVGYRATITSWENDADNYNTVTTDGLSEEDVKFLVEVCKLHTSSGRSLKGEFGNMYSPSDEEIEEYHEAIQKLLDKFPNSGYESVDHVTDKIYDLGLSGGEFYTRVFERIKIEYVPVEIQFEDVTDKFL